MAELIDVCRLDELPAGAVRVVEWEDFDIGVFNCENTIYARENRCSHNDGPLAEGTLQETECLIECPRHGSSFDLRTGTPITLPAYLPVATFPVIVVDDVVRLRVE